MIGNRKKKLLVCWYTLLTDARFDVTQEVNDKTLLLCHCNTFSIVLCRKLCVKNFLSYKVYIIRKENFVILCYVATS